MALGWAFWPVLSDLIANWRNDPNYSSGALVLPAACYIAWMKRNRVRNCRVKPSLWGLLLLAAGLLMRAVGMVFLYESLERYAFVVSLVGLALLIAGPQVFYTLRWVMLFLLLMMPLPGRIHNLVSPRLQELSTAGTVFFMELFGIRTSRQGNILMLNDDVEIGVVEACSGLRMLTAFIIVAALVAFTVRRPTWQKVTVLLSSIPIAVICNQVRLLVTAFLFMNFNSEAAETFFHDFAGVSMMPLAILLMGCELWCLDRLVLADTRSSQAIA
jgi:exosortase